MEMLLVISVIMTIECPTGIEFLPSIQCVKCFDLQHEGFNLYITSAEVTDVWSN